MKVRINPAVIDDSPAPIIKKTLVIAGKGQDWTIEQLYPITRIDIEHPWLDTVENCEICIFKYSTTCSKKIETEDEYSVRFKNKGFKFRGLLPKTCSYEDFKDLLEDYINHYKEGKVYSCAIAIRYPNPEFTKLIDPERVLHDSTTCFKVGTKKIHRYIYSAFTPIKVSSGKVTDYDNYGIGFGVQ